MYLDTFGMQQLPFTYSPNIDFYVGLEGFERTMKNIGNALASENAVVLLTGKNGTGKTLLCRKLMETNTEHLDSVHLLEPYTSPENKLNSIAHQLAINLPDTGEMTTAAMCSELVNLLKARQSEITKPVVLIIDEVQALDDINHAVLLNLIGIRVNGCRIFRVLLSGQPEFMERFNEKRFDELRADMIRVSMDKGMDDEAVFRYINQRVRRSGHHSANLFSPEAIRLIAYASKGNPLLVNLLCHRSLNNAIRDRMVRVGVSQVTDAVRETVGTSYPLLIRPLVTASGSLAFNLMLLVVFIVNMFLLLVII